MWNNLWTKIKPWITLQVFVNFIQEELGMICSFVAKVLGDMFTSWNGDVDPARLIPYLLCGCFGVFFLWLTYLDTIWHHAFNSMAFSTGAVAIGAQFVAAAGGVRIKQSSEIPMNSHDDDHDHDGGGQRLGAKPPKRKTLIRRMVHGAVQGAMEK